MSKMMQRYRIFILFFVVLFLVRLTFIQVINRQSLVKNPLNQRVLYDEYSHKRGIITAGSEILAYSIPNKGFFPYQRVYPLRTATAFSTVTGYYSPWYGRDQLEQDENKVLTGNDNTTTQILDQVLGKSTTGGNVITTLQPKIQEAAYTSLSSTFTSSCAKICTGAAVAIDPQTGKILALVSTPGFDPNVISNANPEREKTWQDLNNNPNKPLHNNATETTYAPGIAFEILVTASALENGYNLNSKLNNYPGCNPNLTISKAFISCPAAINELTVSPKIVNKIKSYLDEYDSGISKQSSAQPLMASASIYHFPTNNKQITPENPADITISPLLAATIIASIGNKGQAMKPYLISELERADLTTIKKYKPQANTHIFSQQTAQNLMNLLIDFNKSTDPEIVKPLKQTFGSESFGVYFPNTKGLNWYIAVGPSINPQIAVAVIIDNLNNNDILSNPAAQVGKTMINVAMENQS